MAFIYQQKIRFKHCDMAGIVFFPRYFEMINDCNEAFFDQILGFPFETLHQDGAVPTADISTQFKSPGRLGDLLDIRLSVTKAGRTSIGLAYEATVDDQVRFGARSVLVRVDLDGRPMLWPVRVAAQIEAQMQA